MVRGFPVPRQQEEFGTVGSETADEAGIWLLLEETGAGKQGCNWCPRQQLEHCKRPAKVDLTDQQALLVHALAGRLS